MGSKAFLSIESSIFYRNKMRYLTNSDKEGRRWNSVSLRNRLNLDEPGECFQLGDSVWSCAR